MMCVVPDAVFADARLAGVYDVVDHDRSDLDVYVDIVAELGAFTVLDVGCGTGTLACRLAQRSIHVNGIDPAAGSLDVARAKPGASAVRWFHGEAHHVPPLGVDLALMTGNVAQVFVDDGEWQRTTVLRARVGPSAWWVLEGWCSLSRRGRPDRWCSRRRSRGMREPPLAFRVG